MGQLVSLDVCAHDGAPDDFVSISSSNPYPFDAAHESLPYGLNFRTHSIGFTPQDTPVYGASLGDAVGAEEGNEVCRNFQWIPTLYHGGWQGDICFEATDIAGHSTEMCVGMTVAKCQWALQEEDSLVEIAPRFGTNWLQLFMLNPEMMHPDSAPKHSTINVGHSYTMEWHDDMSELADRFGTTIGAIQNMNADISDPHNIAEGSQVCILPSSCETSQY